jgi:hypothetical protein
MITQMRKQLIDFHTHLKTEEVMSKLYQQQQAAQDASIQQQTPNGYSEDFMMQQQQQYQQQEEQFMGYQENDVGYFDGEMSDPNAQHQQQQYYDPNQPLLEEEDLN